MIGIMNWLLMCSALACIADGMLFIAFGLLNVMIKILPRSSSKTNRGVKG
jgi:hypothetical protein